MATEKGTTLRVTLQQLAMLIGVAAVACTATMDVFGYLY